MPQNHPIFVLMCRESTLVTIWPCSHVQLERYDIWLGTTPDGTPATTASSYEMYVYCGLLFIFEYSLARSIACGRHRHQHDLVVGPRRVSDAPTLSSSLS